MSRPGSHAVPRPEHPRPDFHRGLRPGIDWLNLNGPWQFSFDPDDRGPARGLHESGAESFPRTIVVPFPWESHLAWGTGEQAGNGCWFSREAYLDPTSVTVENYREAPRQTVGWYRRSFIVPARWQGHRVFLNVGAADWELRAWVNGVPVGEAESGYLPVSFDVTDALVGGENTLVIRVHDPQDESRKPLGKQVPSWYTPTSGIWQTVWLEPRAAAHIDAIQVQPHLAGGLATVTVRTHVPEGAADLAVAAAVRTSTGLTVAELGPVPLDDHGQVRLSAHIRAPIPWAPESPHMYRLRVRLLQGGRAIDEVHTQFGMRDVDVGPLGEDGPAYIRLNGEPIYLRGALDQSFHPQGVYTHPSNAAIRRDLVLAREAGLNFLRLHVKTPDPRYLYWADRVGILLMCDMPNFGYDGYSELARDRWERNLRGTMTRDFNHPSIIAWCLFNETWGLGGREYAQMPERQQWVRECYEATGEMDSTRLVEDNSACLRDHIVTDINSWHFYLNDYDQAREHIEEVVEQTHPGSQFNFAGGSRQGGQPLLNSEYGGISARMGDLDVSWCLLFLTNELRKHEEICGYVYTELTDIEWEHNGLYNYDRSPKQFGYHPALILGELFVGFDCPPARTAAPGDRVTVPVFLRPSARAAELARRVRWSATFTGRLGRARALVRRTRPAAVSGDSAAIELTLPDEPGLARVEAVLDDGRGRPAAMNFCFFEVVGEHAASQDRAVVLRKTAGDCDAAFEGDIERGEVEGDVHLLAGLGDGSVEYSFDLPEDLDPRRIAALHLLVELSSARAGAPQTEAERWPSRARIAIGRAEAAVLALPNQPADSRGALSHMHGLLGRYGQLVRVDLSAERAAAAAADGIVTVRIASEDSGADRGGLAVYSSRAGRYPCDVTLVVESAPAAG